MERILVRGGIYRHFKNKLYMAKDIVIHSETREEMVLYQALYGDFRSYVRPLSMFLSKVDHDKYPDCAQQYRFTQVKLNEAGNVIQFLEEPELSPEPTGKGRDGEEGESSEIELSEIRSSGAGPAENGSAKDGSDKDETERSEQADPLLLAFLDLSSLIDKAQYLAVHKADLTDRTLSQCAAALDIQLPAGDFESRFEALKESLLVRARYEENGRLRN